MKRLDSLEASYRCCWWGFWLFVILLAVGWLTSCTTTRVVPVPEVHEQHHWHTDSVIKRDSVIHDRQTTIRELDSAAMAQYGIQLKQNEKAWMVSVAELRREVERLESMTADRDTVRDSIPVPYPVEKIVPAELSWWQQARIHMANILLYGLVIVGIILLGKWHLKKLRKVASEKTQAVRLMPIREDRHRLLIK